MQLLVQEADWDVEDLTITRAAVDASFQSFDEKSDLIVDIIELAWSPYLG